MKKRIDQIFNLILIVTIIGSGLLLGWCFYKRQTVIPSAQQHVLSLAHQRAQKINTYLIREEHTMRSLAHEKKIIQYFNDYSHREKLKSFLHSYENRTGFQNILLIKPGGKVIFASNDEKKFHINVTSHKYQNMSLAKSFDRAMKTMTPDIASFSFDMLLQEPTLYGTIPVFNHAKKFIGALAVQLNVAQIYTIISNYFGLGKTGDIILGKTIPNGAQIITPTRNDPDATFNIIDYQEGLAVTPIQHAVQGNDGSMITLDYRGEKVIAGWTYIPPLAWGIVVKLGYSEAAQPINTAFTLWYISVLLILILLIIKGVNKRDAITQWAHKNRTANVANIIILVASLLMIAVTIYLAYHYNKVHQTSLMRANQLAQQKINHASLQLETALKNIMQRAQALADDLRDGRLKKNDITLRMKRDIKENPSLSGLIIAFEPHQFEKDRTLYAPHFARHKNGYKEEQIETSYDYTEQSSIMNNNSHVNWYHTALKKGAQWIVPHTDPLTGELIAQYIVPFYSNGKKQKPAGVIVAEFALKTIPLFLDKITIGQTGYAFLVSKGGTFIYHPHQEFVASKKTIFDYAQQQINPELYKIGTTITEGAAGKNSYIDPITSKTTWIHYSPIAGTPWAMALVFIEEETTIPSVMVRHALMNIITALLISILLFAVLMCRIFSRRKKLIHHLALSSGAILLCGVGIVWYIISQTIGSSGDMAHEAIIGNQTSLTAYIKEKQREAATKYQTLIEIPTGLVINSLTFDDVAHISFNGYIWQKYKKDSPLERTVDLLGATRIDLKKVHEEQTAMHDIIGWKVNAQLPEPFTYAQYPFDRKRVIIPLSHPDQHTPIILTPDFTDYENFYHAPHLGIAQNFSLSEFTIENSYFSYRPVEKHASIINVLLDEDVALHYNVLLSRNTLHAFIVYIIPLFVILFSLFAAIAFTRVTETITSTSLIPYTAPLFALIILHGNLRRAFTIGDILYIEYLFFLTYLTILLAITFNILIIWRKNKTQTHLKFISTIIKFFFWPAQFALWYAATIITFY